jgi:hypothetical protein
MSNYKRSAEWALENFNKAQTGLINKIKISIEWKSEDDTDLSDWLEKIADDTTYTAVIGPIYSTDAKLAAEQFASKGKTIVLPIATSTEFQRIYAASNNVWNLAESDITQCEILLTQAKLMDVDNVSLLTANNDYGKVSTTGLLSRLPNSD